MLKFSGVFVYNGVMNFAIPLDGDPNLKFYTKEKLLLATGYIRIVIGGRGPYIEFSPSQIEYNNIYIPDYARYKLYNDLSYYHEFRSNDKCFVKLYHQKIGVGYADYKVGMWYISPFNVITDEYDDLFLVRSEEEPKQEDDSSLFDVI